MPLPPRSHQSRAEQTTAVLLLCRNSGTFSPPGCLVTRSSVLSLEKGLGWGDAGGGVGR